MTTGREEPPYAELSEDEQIQYDCQRVMDLARSKDFEQAIEKLAKTVERLAGGPHASIKARDAEAPTK